MGHSVMEDTYRMPKIISIALWQISHSSSDINVYHSRPWREMLRTETAPCLVTVALGIQRRLRLWDYSPSTPPGSSQSPSAASHGWHSGVWVTSWAFNHTSLVSPFHISHWPDGLVSQETGWMCQMATTGISTGTLALPLLCLTEAVW